MKGIKQKITDFHYGKFSLPLFLVFFVPSIFYYFAISFKNFLYKNGILKEFKTKAFVICVGNLTTGGVGKTPVVIEIANYLASLNKKVAILSRGYGGKTKKTAPVLVRSFDEILIDDVELTGDEVNLISKKVKKSAIVICPNRVKGAEFAVKSLGAEIILMDDGFSNRKIYKDLNIILIDSKKMFGNGFCLPLGPLREPVKEIERAGMVLVVNKSGEKNEKLSPFLSDLKVSFEFCDMKEDGIYNIKTGNLLENCGKKQDIIAFSGIGSPEQFYEKLKEFNVRKTLSFNDHFEYDQKTVDEISDLMKKENAAAAVTTEKDMVKLLKFDRIENFYALELKPSFSFDFLNKI